MAEKWDFFQPRENRLTEHNNCFKTFEDCLVKSSGLLGRASEAEQDLHFLKSEADHQ